MRSPEPPKQSWRGRTLKVVAMDPGEQTKRIHDAVARRAYHIFERRGSTLGHELEDWQRAEFETVSLLDCGCLVLDDKVSLNTDLSVFAEGVIEVCVEPHRLTICGKIPHRRLVLPTRRHYAHPRKESATLERNGSSSEEDFVFRVLDLPVAIEPSRVAARFTGRTLEIDLPKAQATQERSFQAGAAA